ncbi:hypothetical protein OBBRIDRAFT_373638 [Obba rivulosa]|uniref:Uncharacterized protein n=1 Tax=Obba rivulosa TaxID=1052685 RepID=A0A8E2AI20_9APHY|nr:hypothetical protein OBBRIDRAFT_373638 [Obba rivulosa]
MQDALAGQARGLNVQHPIRATSHTELQNAALVPAVLCAFPDVASHVLANAHRERACTWRTSSPHKQRPRFPRIPAARRASVARGHHRPPLGIRCGCGASGCGHACSHRQPPGVCEGNTLSRGVKRPPRRGRRVNRPTALFCRLRHNDVRRTGPIRQPRGAPESVGVSRARPDALWL